MSSIGVDINGRCESVKIAGISKPQLMLNLVKIKYDFPLPPFCTLYRYILCADTFNLPNNINRDAKYGNFAEYTIWLFPEFLLNYRITRLKKRIKKHFDRIVAIHKSLNHHSKLEEELYG